MRTDLPVTLEETAGGATLAVGGTVIGSKYEILGLSKEQIEKVAKIAAAFTAAGRPTSVDDLVRFAFAPTKADFERLGRIKLPKQPWLERIWWRLLDALDALRAMTSPEYGGSE